VIDFVKTASVIEKLLKSHTLDGYEIMLGYSRNLSFEVKEQKVDTFKCSTPVGVSVRVLKSQAMGYSYSSSLEPGDLVRMIDSAVVGAETQSPDQYQAFPLPGAYPLIEGLVDEDLAGLSEELKIGRALELERLTLAADPRIRRVRKSTYGESDYHVYLMNSQGVEGSYRGTSVSSSVSAIAEDNGDNQMGWDFGFSNYFSGVDIESIARLAAVKSIAQLGATRIETMNCPVILDNQVASSILEVLAPAFLAENVQKGKSLLQGRLGERLFASSLRIRDDGTLSGGMATAPFDGEGVAHGNTLLVDEGVLLGYLYDTRSARKDGLVTTGNSVRSGVKGLPHPGVTNFFIENGSVAPARLRSEVKRGVLVTSVMGMHTANPISGDFSVGASGLLIEDGTLSIPVKGLAISGNIIELFRSVDGVGDDLRFFGAVGAPSLRISALDVSGA
jgi:PmbA protein